MTVTNGTVGSEVFLQNDFLSLGLNAWGGVGTNQAAPTGIATNKAGGYSRLGLYADLDGFGKGAETTLQDAIVRGAVVEGFNIGYKIDGSTIVQSNQQNVGLKEIVGTTANTSTAAAGQSTFTGTTAEKLKVEQVMTLEDGAKFIRVDVKLTNTSAAAMNDLRYMRTADPDQGATMVTENKIALQGEGQALVTAMASGGKTPYFLYANDARAVASTYGFINESPYEAAAYSAPQKAGTMVKADQTINLTFGLGTLEAGKSTTVTFYMGVTDDMTATLKAIAADTPTTTPAPTPAPTPKPTPTPAPDAIDDLLSVVAGESATGNVLKNDVDSLSRALTATLKSGPAHGTLKLKADGSFTYAADAGYTGSDSFTYSATAGGQSDVATVKISATAPVPTLPFPKLPASSTLQRSGTIDGSGSGAETLTGVTGGNSFYFDINAVSGKDRITNFGSKDVFVTNKALVDGNADGKIGLAAGVLKLDDADTVKIDGVSGLRYLGTDEGGMSVYADLAVRPKSAIEGLLGNDVLKGGVGDKAKDNFFFDTALGLDLGDDKIVNFGAKDLVLTTSKLADAAIGGTIKLTGGLVELHGDNGADLGSVLLTNTSGAAVSALEFDGTIVRGDVTYYVYSTDGTMAGIGS